MLSLKHPSAVFRLYRDEKASFGSTFFDLIHGDTHELKQTKALAYLLSERPSLVSDLAAIEPLRSAVEKAIGRGSQTVDRVEVNAELMSTSAAGKDRADIVIKMSHRTQPVLALVIEGKNSRLQNVDRAAIKEQLDRYMDGKTFPDLARFNTVGIALTRYETILQDYVSLSWSDILELVIARLVQAPGDRLLAQFRDFLTEVDPTMHYYEVEVLSVPAGKTFPFVEKHSIYGCPDTKAYNYRKPLRITFREIGSVMKSLRKIEEIIVFDPTNDSDIDAFKSCNRDESVKERVVSYIADRKASVGFAPRPVPYRFYILSVDDVIPLPHQPRRVARGRMYFKLSTLLDPENLAPDPDGSAVL